MAEKIRVLRIIARMNIGGPAVQVEGISKNINQDLFEHLLVTGYCERDEVDYLDSHESTIPVVRIDGLGRSVDIRSDLRAFLRMRSVINEYKPHIIHTHTAKAGFLGRLASMTVRQKSKRIHTFHGHLLSGYFSPFKTKLIIAMERFLALFTDAIVGVGYKVADDLLEAKIGNAKKFSVINPGLVIQTTQDRNQTRNELGIAENDFLVSWVGRFTEIKAPERVLEIARITAKNQESVKFLMVGGGALLESIELQAHSENLPIIFLGWRNDAQDLIRASDLLLLTSKNEGTPISSIQAQSLGIPVLSTDVGAVSEIVTDNDSGFVKSYDSTLFYNLIMTLYEDKTRWSEFSSKAKSMSKDRYSVSRLVEDHEKLYQKLMFSHRSS